MSENRRIDMKTYIIVNKNDLIHYGVLGMKWGIRRYQPYSVRPRESGKIGQEIGDAIQKSKRLRKSKAANLDKFGSDSKHNTLYIMGFSGSGKSTAANDLARKNDTIVNLDLFIESTGTDNSLELMAPHGKDIRIREYLNEKIPNYKSLTNKSGRLTKQWFNTLDSMMAEIEKFSEEEYKHNRRVIIEGVQLLDDTVYPNKKFFKDKPVIIMGTNMIDSLLSAAKRDNESIIRDVVPSINKYSEWYSILRKNIKDVRKITNASHLNRR